MNRRLLVILVLIPLCLCLLVVGVLWAFFQFSGEPPGEGAKAEQGYEVCAPAIAALEQYRADQGSYPETLEALSPDYLEDIPVEVNGLPVEYQRSEDSYTLEFSYVGPGMNRCTYTPETEWDCFGYY